jgi:S-adenosylmethionine/arginine decarboxylase-like enzyme
MFGKSYHLDMYHCREGVCDDMELHYRFLEELVTRIKMSAMSPPFVIHAPTKYRKNSEGEYNREEIYPDKAGISCFIPLIESGISIHSLEPSHFACMDLFSCGEFDIEVVREFARERFGFERHEEYLLYRGLKYGSTK